MERNSTTQSLNNSTTFKKRRPRNICGVSKLSYFELLLDFLKGSRIFTLQVLHESSALIHFIDETAAGRVVLFVIAQVLGEIFNLCGQNSDLDLRRTGIGVVCAELLDEVLLLGCTEHSEGDFVA